MTAIQHITEKEMLRRTGVNALGYTYPDKDLILLRKGLTGKKKQNVLAHEVEHLKKGEEGPFLGSVISGGLSLLGGALAGKAQDKASERAIDYQQQQAAQTRADLTPYRGFGLDDYNQWKDSSAGSFRFQQPGYGDETYEAPLSYEEWLGQSGGNALNNTTPRAARPKREGTLSQSQLNNVLGGEFQPYQVYTGANDLYVISPDMLGTNKLGTRRELSTSGTRNNAQRYMTPQQYSAFTAGDIELALPDDPRLAGIPGRAGRGVTRTAQPTQRTGGNNNNAFSAYQSYLDSLNTGKRTGADFRTDPAYQFRLNEGIDAVENSAVARGGLLSGNALRGITDYAQDFASQEYGKIYDREYQRQIDEYLTDYQRKYGDVNLGYSAAAGGAQLGLTAANQIGGLYQQQGRDRANTYGNVFSGVAGAYGDYQGNKQWNDFLDRAYPR